MRNILKLQITTKEYKHEKAISVDFTDNQIIKWCLYLCLLKENLIKSITLIDEKGTLKLKIKYESSLPFSYRGKVFWHQDRVELHITTNELEYWMHFFLKYYRDGRGEVPFISTDISANKSNTTKGLMLYFKVPKVVKPISEEQLRRKLGF